MVHHKMFQIIFNPKFNKTVIMFCSKKGNHTGITLTLFVEIIYFFKLKILKKYSTGLSSQESTLSMSLKNIT